MLRSLALLSLFVPLFACGSSVDLCAGGAVCGSDGRTYGDRCAALSAQVEVAYLGACAIECPAIDCALACEHGFASGPDGCPACACAECERTGDCEVGECVRGACVVPTDGGADAGVDGGEVDGGGVDAGPTDGGIVLPDDAGSCPDALDFCGGLCVDLESDFGNCGECGAACPTILVDGTVACVEGDCAIVECPGTKADCDEEPEDGCEVELATDVDHCGACGNSCGSSELCVGGVCMSGAEACRDPNNWVVEEETARVCRATCGELEVSTDGLLGRCGLGGLVCNLLTPTASCQERAASCCFPS